MVPRQMFVVPRQMFVVGSMIFGPIKIIAENILLTSSYIINSTASQLTVA